MSRRNAAAIVGVLMVLAAACAPAPEDDGRVLTLDPPSSAPTTTTPPPVTEPAAVTLRTSGGVNRLVPLKVDNRCTDDRNGTLTVQGAATDGTALSVTVLNPVAGRYPVAAGPAAGPSPEPARSRVTDVTLRIAGREYKEPASGQITISVASPGHRGTISAQAFPGSPALKMTADWECPLPLPSPAPR